MEVLRRSSRPVVDAADGSTVRELAHPSASTATGLSLAEATVPAGGSTHLHLHRRSEEIYWVVSGTGRMRLAEEERDIAPGDAVVIPPGAPHRLRADAGGELMVVCACAPPYSEEDTEVLDREPWPVG
jgi:mannose-6-phosphate isomerase-like protein (cupin superfamily)